MGMMAVARTGNRMDGSRSGARPKFHTFGWSRIMQVAINNLVGPARSPARSNEELLASARVSSWKEQHTYI